jgi:cytochrome d ubiquinol oxidase subunit I
MFWTFRVMVALGLFFIGLFTVGFVLAARRRLMNSQTFLRIAFWALPLPWVAAELGWIVAEYGRQPWAIAGVLPTFLAVSPIPAANVALSLTGFVVFYSLLAVIDVYLLRKYIRRGPEHPTTPEVGALPAPWL